MAKVMGAVAAALAVVMLVMAPVSAAQPKTGVYQQKKSNGDMKIQLTVDSHKRVFPEVYNKCSAVPVMLHLKVDSQGHFHFKGTAKNVIQQPISVNISGTFISKTVATGSAHYWTSKCSAAGFKFRATWVSA